MAKRELIIRAAAKLRSTATDEWDGLVAALQVFSREYAQDLVRAQLDVLQQAQGRAQGIDDIVQTLATAHTELERLSNRDRR